MDIKTIIVTYTETANLGDYSNVKPSATIEVVVHAGEDQDQVMAEATAYVRGIVRNQVDDALEANDRRPRYTTEPLYAIFVRHRKQTGGQEEIAIVGPVDADYGRGFSAHYRGLRLPAVQRLAAEHYGDAQLLDTTVEHESALMFVLEQVAAEDAAIDAEQERQRQERERKYQEQVQAWQAKQSDEDEEEDPE